MLQDEKSLWTTKEELSIDDALNNLHKPVSGIKR